MENEESKNIWGYALITIGVVLLFILVQWIYTIIFDLGDSSIYKIMVEAANHSRENDEAVSFSLSGLISILMISLSIIVVGLGIIIKSLFYSGALILSKERSIEKLLNEIHKIKEYWSKNIQ